MIQLLKNWQEIGDATLFIQRQGLPSHTGICKNWDHFWLYQLLKNQDKQAKVIDLGCGDGSTLKLISSLGFSDVHGIDFQISWSLRLYQMKSFLKRKCLPFVLHKGDITYTKFPDQTYDFAISISVIEHGVDINKFLKESYRILKNNGTLFITTDYWEEKIETAQSTQAFGLSWKVFSQHEINTMITLAKEVGFVVDEQEIPACEDKNILWNNAEYTFIGILFRKID